MKTVSLLCPACDHENRFHPEVAKRGSFDGKVPCEHCKVRFKPYQEKKGSGDAQRRSKQQEAKAAKRYGARRQAGSGASPRAKGDIRDPGRLLGECKHTIRRTFTLKLDDLMKLEQESTSSEHRLFELEFQGVYPPRRYVVLGERDYLNLLSKEDLEDRAHQDDPRPEDGLRRRSPSMPRTRRTR